VPYAAQANAQIDAEIAEKGRFRMKTSYHHRATVFRGIKIISVMVPALSDDNRSIRHLIDEPMLPIDPPRQVA